MRIPIPQYLLLELSKFEGIKILGEEILKPCFNCHPNPVVGVSAAA